MQSAVKCRTEERREVRRVSVVGGGNRGEEREIRGRKRREGKKGRREESHEVRDRDVRGDWGNGKDKSKKIRVQWGFEKERGC